MTESENEYWWLINREFKEWIVNNNRSWVVGYFRKDVYELKMSRLLLMELRNLEIWVYIKGLAYCYISIKEYYVNLKRNVLFILFLYIKF